MPYCTVADLLIGDIQTSAQLDPQKYVNDAADEIDSKIGFRYTTPIQPESAGTPRPVVLLLKRLNAHLATGRLILAATISANQEELNAYGASLVEDVQLVLAAISGGDQRLPGAELLPGTTATDPLLATPILLSNLDAESGVEGFYTAVAGLTNESPSPYQTYRAASG